MNFGGFEWFILVFKNIKIEINKHVILKEVHIRRQRKHISSELQQSWSAKHQIWTIYLRWEIQIVEGLWRMEQCHRAHAFFHFMV